MTTRSTKRKNILQKIHQGRIRGKAITSDFQNEEIPHHIASFLSSSKETTILLLILYITLTKLPLFSPFSHITIFVFLTGLLTWEICQKGYAGWIRLKKLHQVIQEERWEIEHHREQEKRELQMIYQAKGFSGKLLDDVVDRLMADDNRLLQIMLEEEMGITLQTYVHPLKQSMGAGLGVLAAAGPLAIGYFFPPFGIFIVAILILIANSFLSFHFEKISLLEIVVWTLAIAFFVSACCYFTLQLIIPFFT